MPLESPLIFYPSYLAETLRKQVQWFSLFLRHYFILKRVIKDPRRFEYTDLAIAAVDEDELETHELFHTADAQDYLVRIQKAEKLRRGVAV